MAGRITKRIVDSLQPGARVWDGEIKRFGVRRQAEGAPQTTRVRREHVETKPRARNLRAQAELKKATAKSNEGKMNSNSKDPHVMPSEDESVSEREPPDLYQTPFGPSRRIVIAGAATGLAAALVTPALAQQKPERLKEPTSSVPAEPKNYPAPPFPKQQQPWPGLASKMTPRPDHGEKSYKGSGRLSGRKALITGGDSGMGRAAAIAFAREGADVAINYLPAEEPDAREVIDLIRAENRKAVAIPGDIRDENFCKRLVADAVRDLGGLDILVNNAARQISQESILDITSEQFDTTFKTNVYATFWITKAALPHLKRGATIINTASVVAYDPPEYIVDYAATKGAIMIFTKGLAKQLAKQGIRVNAVAPGPVWTPLQVTGGQSPERLPNFGGDTPMGRPGQPAELAALYVLLASDESSYSTGQVFAAVGGHGGP